jgi:aminoglycoside phosphotransferase (APT) family kinase protein
MTCVPGQVFLTPTDPDRWLGQMAAALARIHAADIDAPQWASWHDVNRLAIPEWSVHPDAWRKAIAIVADPPANPATCFIHRDYQHFNMLWSRQRLTGIIDWPNACVGPPEIDVGHCRLNLAVLFSADWAERFRRAYEAEAGRTVDSTWDVQAILSYGQAWKRFIPIQVDGRAVVDTEGMDGRIDALMAAAVARI